MTDGPGRLTASWATTWRTLLGAAVDVVVPLRCVACAEPLEQADRSDGAGAWVVGGWTSDRVRFTPFTTFAVPHGLGREPTQVVCQTSFSADGPLAEQSGSVCLWLTRCGAREGRTDREVLVRNSGSQDFWVRFIIR